MIGVAVVHMSEHAPEGRPPVNALRAQAAARSHDARAKRSVAHAGPAHVLASRKPSSRARAARGRGGSLARQPGKAACAADQRSRPTSSSERAGQRLLDLGHLGAEGNAGSRPVAPARRRARPRVVRRRLRSPRPGSAKGGLELAGAAAPASTARLEGAVGDPEHGDDDVAVGLAAQVGDAVLGDDDIAQLPRHGRVGVAPDDVGDGAAIAAGACCARR